MRGRKKERGEGERRGEKKIRRFLFSLPVPSPLPLTRPISSSLREVSTWRFREHCRLGEGRLLPAYCGAFARLAGPRVGHLQILHCPGAGHLPTTGQFPSFSHTRTRIRIPLHRRFYWKKKQIGSSVKDRNKLKRVVKACSRFYACISSLLIKPELHSEIGAIDVNQRFLVIESNFC